ncbi:MAG: RHS repeat-associated core domain-containing protein [Salinivirgaceae bacterium]|jgi:RHS repeat-associated protein|nr:RHS repeat-associated core domain-containing protein [Salinivirgaceae bacterium]
MHLHTGEARMRRAGQSIRFDYTLKDHLGNTRTMFTITDNNNIETLQSNHYYPFGMRFNQSADYSGTENRYLYNGKELQEDLGLNWYDYGARFYDPSIGRFTNVDPMAESYYGLSGYNYVGNNPIRRIDPDGRMMSEIYDIGGNSMYGPDWFQNEITGDVYFNSEMQKGDEGTGAMQGEGWIHLGENGLFSEGKEWSSDASVVVNNENLASESFIKLENNSIKTEAMFKGGRNLLWRSKAIRK